MELGGVRHTYLQMNACTALAEPWGEELFVDKAVWCRKENIEGKQFILPASEDMHETTDDTSPEHRGGYQMDSRGQNKENRQDFRVDGGEAPSQTKPGVYL